MKYSVDEIIKYVREVFGEGYIEGAFISKEAVSGDIGPEDDEIITSFSPLGYLSDYDPPNAEIYMGMTKLVIDPHDTKYVIKIPFTGFYTWDEDESNRDEDGVTCWDNLRTNFRCAGGICGSNVCELEIKAYEKASDDLQKILMPNEFVTNLDGLNIYIQEKFGEAYENYDEFSYCKTISDVKKGIITKIVNTTWQIGTAFVGRLVDSFGITKAKEIVNELSYIDDLHPGNYGFGKNGCCVVFDYAGYDENYYDFKFA